MNQLYLAVAAFLASLVLVQVARWLSIKTGRVAYPRTDRWHKKPTPILGGIGIYFSFLVILLIFVRDLQSYWPLLLSGTALFGLGLYDDYRELAPTTKIIGQILAAGLVIFVGYRIEFFEFELLNILLTFAWLIGITNAINLIDNMDGLAGGIALIVGGFLAYYFSKIPDQIQFYQYSLILCGAIAGFLIYNFPPAKIFMGDSGSMFIGFSLAALAVVKKTSASNVFAVLGIPLLLFLLPIIDTTLVTITRILRGQSPVQGGRDHTSHRLIAFGLNERQTILVLYLIAIISGIASTVIERVAYDFSLVFVPILIISLSILAAYLGRLQVVPSANPNNKNSTITRVVVELTYRQRLFEIFLDFFLISIAYYLGLWAEYNLRFNPTQINVFVQTLPIAVAGTYLSFYIFGVYRGVWEYFGLDDLLVYVRAVIGAVVFVGIGLRLILPSAGVSLFTMVLFGIFLLLGLAATRGSFRVLDQIYTNRTATPEAIVLLYGAGATGELLARWLLLNPAMGYKPVGFIDDDPRKWGREIHGIKVLGGTTNLESILNEHHPEGLLITSQSLTTTPDGNQALRKCQEHGLWVRQLRFEFELLE